MNMIELLVLLVVAGVCGSIGQSIAGYSRGGCLTAIVLGFVGALFGVWLARSMGLPEPLSVRIGEADFPVLWSIIGASLFVALVGFLSRGGRRTR